jgi:hypothetical protein
MKEEPPAFYAGECQTHGFILVFDSEEHFRAYAPHPDHQPISQELRRICQTIIDFDLSQE